MHIIATPISLLLHLLFFFSMSKSSTLSHRKWVISQKEYDCKRQKRGVLLFVFSKTKQSGVERTHDRLHWGWGRAKMSSLTTFDHPQNRKWFSRLWREEHQRREESLGPSKTSLNPASLGKPCGDGRDKSVKMKHSGNLGLLFQVDYQEVS